MRYGVIRRSNRGIFKVFSNPSSDSSNGTVSVPIITSTRFYASSTWIMRHPCEYEASFKRTLCVLSLRMSPTLTPFFSTHKRSRLVSHVIMLDYLQLIYRYRRPDDFSYTLALGDSITAGLFSRGIQTNHLLDFSEWRGESYAAGADPGAITIPNASPFLYTAVRLLIDEICS